jgi:hypothetical protein
MFCIHCQDIPAGHNGCYFAFTYECGRAAGGRDDPSGPPPPGPLTGHCGSWCRYSDIIDKAITGWTCNARCRFHDVLQVDPLCFWTWNIVPGVPDHWAKLDFLKRMFWVGAAVLGLTVVEVAHFLS